MALQRPQLTSSSATFCVSLFKQMLWKEGGGGDVQGAPGDLIKMQILTQWVLGGG